MVGHSSVPPPSLPIFTPSTQTSFMHMLSAMSAYSKVDEDFDVYNANEVYDEADDK
uniref:Uncharacterized protein n=1 Tax=Aegilops tauschii TaxID=37682 RepID=N1QZE4_AEGTA